MHGIEQGLRNVWHSTHSFNKYLIFTWNTANFYRASRLDRAYVEQWEIYGKVKHLIILYQEVFRK